eukprot:254505_1
MASEVSDHSENDEKNTTPRATERTEMVGKAQQSTSSAGAPHDAVLTGIQKGFDPIEGLIQTMFQRRSDSDDKSDTEAAFCSTCGDRINDLQKFEENQQNCQECTKLKELGIIKMISLQFTIEFFDYIFYGVWFSPMVWIWIPLTNSSADLFVWIISIYLVISSITLVLFIYYLYKNKVSVLHKIPLGLTPIDNYTYIMMVCVLMSNVLICVESLRVYHKRKINIVFACNNLYHYGIDNAPGHCLVYSHLLSNAVIIFICAFLINLIIMRGVKYDAKKSWKKVKTEVIPSHHRRYQYYDNLERRYYSIYKFQRSPVPTMQIFIKRHAKGSFARLKAWIILIAASLFCLVICCSSFYIIGSDFISKLKNQPGQFVPVILSIICSNIMFNLLFVSLYELSWVFEKAYAVMSVCTKPFKDASAIHEDMSVNFDSEDKTEQMEDIDSNALYGEVDINVNDIKIWWDLRSYAFRTLPLFYEISAPIMTVLVLAVIGLTFYFLYELFITFESDVDELKSAIGHENIRFILMVFTAVIIVKTMYILKIFLRPYGVLGSQIKMAEKQVIALRFEMVNEQTNAKRKKYLSECIGLYEKLIKFMNVEKSTKAPRILGVKVTWTKLQALRSYIISFVVVFAGSVWESWFGAVHSLANN